MEKRSRNNDAPIILRHRDRWMPTTATPYQRVSEINKRYAKFLNALEVNIGDPETMRRILTSPSLRTIQAIFMESDDSRYAQAYFAQVADRHFLRYADSMGDDVAPNRIRWQDTKHLAYFGTKEVEDGGIRKTVEDWRNVEGCSPLSDRWIPWVTVAEEEGESLGYEYIEETVIRKVRYRSEVNPHIWDEREEPVTRTRRVEKFRKWPVFALKDGWFEEYKRYYLNEREAAKYRQLQAACDKLNEFFAGDSRGASLPSYLEWNPQTRLIEPTGMCDDSTFNFP